MNSFEDFIILAPTYKSFKDNETAKMVYKFLSRKENVLSMIYSTKNKQPALTECITEIESKYNSKEFDLSNKYVRQAIGTMIKIILKPFGYQTLKIKKLKKEVLEKSKYFKNASVYKYNEANVKVTIELNFKEMKEEL